MPRTSKSLIDATAEAFALRALACVIHLIDEDSEPGHYGRFFAEAKRCIEDYHARLEWAARRIDTNN